MAKRIWKVVNDDIVGYGGGFRAIVYTTPGNEFHDVKPVTTVLVYKGDKRVAKNILNTPTAAKRWAETNYLKKAKP